MKRLISTTIFTLICSISVFSQNRSVCPTVKMTSPNTITKAGDVMTFAASIIGEIENSELEYKWNVSIGEIVSGQEKPVITVMTTLDMAGGNVTATVEINGLPAGCENKFSEIGGIAHILNNLDCFCDFSPKSVFEEMAILDNILIQLRNNTDLIAIFYLFFEKNPSSKQLDKRIRKMINYFPTKFSAVKDKIIFVKAKGEPNSFRVPIYIKGHEKIDCDDCEIVRDLNVYLKKVPKKNTKRNK